MEVSNLRNKITLFLSIALLSLTIACSGGNYQAQRQCGVFSDINGRLYNVDCNTGHAYYLDQNGQVTTVVVPATAVPSQNGQPVYTSPDRARQTQAGSNATINTPNTAPVDPNRRISTVPQAQRTQPQAQQSVPAQRQPRVSTVPQAQRTAPATTPRPTTPRVSTVPQASRKP